MIVNVIHRPAWGKQYEMFRLQQSMAHELGLKVTVLVPYDFLFDEKIVADILKDNRQYGDEIGIWFGEIATERMNEVFCCKEPFLWLHTKENKRRLITEVLRQFQKAFQALPEAVGCYHVDAYSMALLRELCPQIKVSIAGCFEEGVKVFHGCNHSWYLFNEGMPWWPWYPAKNNTLRPARDEEDWAGIVAVPHLCRDLALSYEGRNDFFASHPSNIQRAMANEGAVAPYVLNLLDVHRFQERYNDGFSYTNVFVGPNWLSGSANVQDSDEITQGLYREYLEYFAALRSEGKLQDMHLSEFADWYREHMPMGRSQVFDAKEMLYGSGKEYFWYLDPSMRVTVDPCQGGSIGDLRPFVAAQERCPGADMPQREMASNPYLIHSQYRTGNAHHYEDGARTTLLLSHGGQTLDLADYPVKVADIVRQEEKTTLTLTPAKLKFRDGLTLSLQTVYTFQNSGDILMERRITECSDSAESVGMTEYVKGCYGTTEYPQPMEGIQLAIREESGEQSLEFHYTGESISSVRAQQVSASIPALETEISLCTDGDEPRRAQAQEGVLFNPYYTLKLEGTGSLGKGVSTWLTLRKKK